MEGGRVAAGEQGMALLEVIIGAVLVAIAAVGVALMFSSGQASIHADADNRIALFLANQRIEQLRARGFDAVAIPDPETATPNDLTDEGYPGYRRTTVVTEQCPTNFTLLRSAPLCDCNPSDYPVCATQTTKVVAVTITPMEGTSTTVTDRMATPVTIQAVLIKTQ
jgi:type II secretory pathway pseudopilin PulG